MSRRGCGFRIRRGEAVGQSHSRTIPVDAGAGPVVTQIVLHGVVLAERLEVTAGLLAVHPDLMHVVVRNQIVLREGRCRA